MKLQRFSRLRGHRIFRDFTWAAPLEDFGRFNLIYGWNGSGKTTLSNLLRTLEKRQPITEGQVEFTFDGTKVTGPELAAAALPQVRVFNRDFVARNVFEAGSPHLPPVFVFGEESAEKQRKIDEIKARLPELTKAALAAAGRVTTATTSLTQYAADKARGIKVLLTTPGGGPFNNYDAGNFRVDIKRALEQSQDGKAPSPLPGEEFEGLKGLINGRPMAEVTVPAVSFPDVISLHRGVREALGRKVVSSVLTELTARPEVAAWVGAGLPLHTDDGDASHCKFCEQPLPPARLRQLEAHFNDEFKRLSAELADLVTTIESAAGDLRSVSLLRKTELYSELQAAYEEDRISLEAHLGNVAIGLDGLARAVSSKKERMFESLDLSSVLAGGDGRPNAQSSTLGAFLQAINAGLPALSEFMGRRSLTQLVRHVESHNERTRNFEEQVKLARERLRDHELVEALSGWTERQNALDVATEVEKGARQAQANSEAELKMLEADILEHRPPADELNQELISFLGREEIQLAVEDTGYRVLRGGHPANDLSEGERTAISFLYFLKSLQDRSFDLASGIVVIDDPVSSLDSNSLYSAFGFMKRRVAGAGQLFVLTHNFTFFRQVRNWFEFLNRGKKAERPARFYMLRTTLDGGRRGAVLTQLDPFLQRYESEYHYVFKRVMAEAERPAGLPLETYYEIPNLARRLLESFLAFKVPDATTLHARLEAVEFDGPKKTRILRFVDTHSHAEQIAEGHDDASGLAEAPAVLKDLIELLRKCDQSHFDAMCRAMQ